MSSDDETEEDPQHVAELQAMVEKTLDMLDGKSQSDCMVVIANIIMRYCNDQDDPDGHFLKTQELTTIIYRKVRLARLAAMENAN